MKRTLLFYLTLLSFSTVFAQQSNRFVVKLSDGNTYDLNLAGAFIDPDRSVSIYAKTSSNIKHSFLLRIKPGKTETKGVVKAKYYFNSTTRRLEYVPGDPNDYELVAYYSEENNKVNSQDWIAKNNSEIGYIEIESISAERVKGKFYCQLIQETPVSGAKKIMEGTFDVAVMKSDVNAQSNGKPSNSGSSSVTQPASKALKFSEREPLIGLYDLQFAASVITTGEMGYDVDFGATVLNLSYGKKSDASATVELHYDYSRQKFDNTMLYSNFRRNHVYARLRPYTSNPNAETYADNIAALFVGGLYVDLGYTKGYYFYTDLYDVRKAPDYNADGLFWGIGWNLIIRKENRWGANVGFGSKRYTIIQPNGTESKNKTRLITLGAVYNLKWKD